MASPQLNRKRGVLKEMPTVLVICEDTKSCRTYLGDAARHFRAFVSVEHCGRTDPIGIVKEAVGRKSRFDKVFCAIDRDSHETFDEAVALASMHTDKITLITSYPCYEIWLYFHFKKTRSPYVAAGAKSPGDLMVKDLQKLPEMNAYTKSGSVNLFEELLIKLPDGMTNADWALAEAAKDNERNPSTDLHFLLRYFETLGKSVPA